MGQAATSSKALSEYDDYRSKHPSSPKTKAWAAKLTLEGKRLGSKSKKKKSPRRKAPAKAE